MSFPARKERNDSDAGGETRGEGGNEGRRPRPGGAGGGFRRRKQCPFTGPNAQKIDYKDVRTLGRYVSERGKIMPARLSGVANKHQRKLANAIKRARFLALMPYVGEVKRGYGGDR